MDLKAKIRTVEDWPKEGIAFRDITPLLLQADTFQYITQRFVERYKSMSIDKIAGIDARGFIFGATLAHELNLGFIPIRKSGKLPFDTLEQDYALEYGSSTLEVHTDAVTQGERVIIIDDLIATGGSASAASSLIKQLGGSVVECAFVIEITHLKGRTALSDDKVFSLIQYDE